MSDRIDEATKKELERDIAFRTEYVATLDPDSEAFRVHSDGVAQRIAQLAFLLTPLSPVAEKSKAIQPTSKEN